MHAESLPQLRKDEFWAVNDVSFELKRGECLGLIGHNGAGKSTLLKMLNGLIKPDHGRITMKGRIGALIELNVGFNPVLTGRENVYIYGSILGFSKKEIDLKYDKIVEFAEMADFMEMPFRSYSSGMKVRLGFAVAMQMEPDVLIIDEILAVGDVGFRYKCYDAINNMIKKAAVIIVSHHMQHIDRLSSQCLLLDKGSVKAQNQAINKTITEYYRILKHSNKIFSEKNCRIDNIIINSNNIVPNCDIKLNQMGSFELQFSIDIPYTYKELDINITFMNLAFEPIAGIRSNGQNMTISNTENPKLISVKLDRIQLGTSSFYISITIADSKSGRVLIWNHAVSRILTYGTDYLPFPVNFYANWSIKDQNTKKTTANKNTPNTYK